MKAGVIVAARHDSRRLPGKALLPLLGLPLLQLLLRRLKMSRHAAGMVLATTNLVSDDALVALARAERVDVYRGAVDDVLGRCVAAAAGRGFTHLVRVTGDCPLLDGATLDVVIDAAAALPAFDLATTKPQYPHGIDLEIVPLPLLTEINDRRDLAPAEREHMLNYIYSRQQQYRIVQLQPPAAWLGITDTFMVDTDDDYARLSALVAGDSPTVPTDEIIRRCARA